MFARLIFLVSKSLKFIKSASGDFGACWCRRWRSDSASPPQQKRGITIAPNGCVTAFLRANRFNLDQQHQWLHTIPGSEQTGGNAAHWEPCSVSFCVFCSQFPVISLTLTATLLFKQSYSASWTNWWLNELCIFCFMAHVCFHAQASLSMAEITCDKLQAVFSRVISPFVCLFKWLFIGDTWEALWDQTLKPNLWFEERKEQTAVWQMR